MARDDFKTVTINNRTFFIHKFDALTGSYTMMKVGGILLLYLISWIQNF